jgi:uncharacterized protein YjbJ (UPF0337 family)
MGEARLKGSAKKVGGNVKGNAGNLARTQTLKREGVFERIKGKVQNALGGITSAMKRK